MKPIPLLLLLTLSAGCSSDSDEPERFSVEGVVQMDGQMVTQASIRFIPDADAGNAGPAAFGNVKDGLFHLAAEQGLVAGKSDVEITIESGSDSSTGSPPRTITQSIDVEPSGTNLFSFNLESREIKPQAGDKVPEGDSEDEED